MESVLAAGVWWTVRALVLLLCALALLRLMLARHHRVPSEPALQDGTLPHVTVQLPLRNEAAVVERLLDAVCALDWPRDRLDIQVLDDSTDETVTLAARRVAFHAARGVAIRHVRRVPQGFKAGALAHGTHHARGELLAILDADFLPPPDWLRRLVGHFQDPQVAMVQARWTHLNERASVLTRVQALMLNAHFCVEQRGRHAGGHWFNFNGTAGLWRRSALEAVGGWRADSLTEDLDLSYRAQLAGWKAVYRDDVTVPAELPMDMPAFATQQHRWSKGSAQVARLLGAPLFASDAPWAARAHAGMHVLGNMSYLLLAVLALLLPLLPWAQRHVARTTPVDAPLWGAAAVALLVFCAVGAMRARASVGEALCLTPLLAALGAGISLRSGLGVVEGLLGIPSGFVRTPKRGTAPQARYRTALGAWPWMESVAAGWLAWGAWQHAALGQGWAGATCGLFVAGLVWVAGASWLHARTSHAVPSATQSVHTGAGQAGSDQVGTSEPVRQTA